MASWTGLVLLLPLLVAAQESPYYNVPDPVIQALQPRGLRVSIPDVPGVELFAVHANVNKPLRNLEAGQISQDVTKARDGRWTFEDQRVRLKPGDVISYWLYVQVDGLGYRKDDQTYTVTELVPPETPVSEVVAAAQPPPPGALPPPPPPAGAPPLPPPPGCQPSSTVANEYEQQLCQLKMEVWRLTLANIRQQHELRLEQDRELHQLRLEHQRELHQERLKHLKECGGQDPPGQHVWRFRRSAALP